MTHRIRIYGIVQGVGFRPTVARYAATYNIRGTVSNRGPFVEIMAEGDSCALAQFEDAVRNHPPKRAILLRMDVTEISDRHFTDFSIIESKKTGGDILISPDIAICDDCKRELYDRQGRRYLHPFINCTCCGPRLTILDAMPYDRERTSMGEFTMCGPCASEYSRPDDRRYDAQPVCCNDCGPVVYLLELEREQADCDVTRYRDLSNLSHEEMEEVRAAQRQAITRIRRTIAGGGIVAIKGIGGYHLCCDATSSAAVSLLRERKRRPAKPFAVMMRDMETVSRYCEVSPEAEGILTGHQKPIILLQKKAGCRLADEVAPDNPTAGVMLPYAPIQLLLFDYDDEIEMPDALVMTSANISGAPIVRDEADAIRELSALCDEILAHNRQIRIRADDTVMDLYHNEPYMIRRSRGYAPLPVMTERLHDSEQTEYGPIGTAVTGANLPETVLAIGGELKNTFCVRIGDLSYLSPYVGDMEDVRTIKALRETVQRFLTLLEAKPQAIVCDLHPKYNTSAVAEELAEEMGIPVYKIQHHYAHVLSCLAENDAAGPVIGVALDGTGYGDDGSIWGGEILVADTRGYERAGSILPFRQIGGDAAAREGWRIAVSMIYDICEGRQDEALRLIEDAGICGADEARILMRMADAGLNTAISTSCGRLFDAASALLGIRRASTFEGEASMALQFAAERGRKKLRNENRQEQNPYAPVGADGGFILPTDKLFEHLLKARIAGEDVEVLAYAFHESLAEMIVDVCSRIREQRGLTQVALTGGCYQNRLLLELTEDGLTRAGFTVLRHRMVPPNDGGLALGQAAWAGARGNINSISKGK